MTSLSAPQVLTAVASLLGAGYIDARYGVSYDLRKLYHTRVSQKRIGERIRELGDEATLYRLLELADQEAEALWFEGQSFTYGEMKTKVDGLARFLHNHGVQPDHVVGVFCTNSPEMVFTIYALGRLGALPALLNTALRNETLKHCISISGATVIIATPDLAQFIPSDPSQPLRSFSLDLGYHAPIPSSAQTTDLIHITPTSLSLPLTSIPRPKKTAPSPWLLLFTSGTTGHPKAVSLKTILLISVSVPLPQDTASPSNRKKYYPLRTYCCLPLFHATGFLSGLAHSVGTSSTLCLSRHFSATSFSRSLYESRATRLVYVGEILRYALAAPASEFDTQHAVLVASGNGLAGDIWQSFQRRFGIAEIREVYRSTEGVGGFDNLYPGLMSVGKVGFQGWLARRGLEDGIFIVRYDDATEALYRDPETGFCVQAQVEEPGEAVARVVRREFYAEYYGDGAATERKLVRDVFRKGDLFQRMGDLLVRDRHGWVRFHERTGDTFRWRGENVSAAEVRGHMVGEDVSDVCVYGTKIPGYDGAVGTAGVTLLESTPAKERAFVEGLYGRLRGKGVPDYAIPRLVRFTRQIDIGVTFKHAKEVLKKRSWNPADQEKEGEEGDRLYWLDGKTYRRLDERAWKSIFEGAKARL